MRHKEESANGRGRSAWKGWRKGGDGERGHFSKLCGSMNQHEAGLLHNGGPCTVYLRDTGCSFTNECVQSF